VVNYEMPLVTKHGEERVISWSTANRFTAEGELLEFIGIGTDVSPRKAAEEKLQKSEQQLRQAQKMEAVGRLAGGVAHDFNNLLTIITGYSQMLLTRLAPDDPARAELAEIKEAGDRAVALTGQLLAFSRKQVVQLKVLDLNAVVTNLDKMLQRLIGEDILLATALAPSVGRVKADPGQIEQIIMNLAVNARDAMPRGGKLTFETADMELDDTYANHMVAVQPGSYVMLAVSDTGCGMDAETQAHIFEPFFTTKEQGKGTGLGLSMVYGIVKQNDGYIWCYSEVGHGTTFKIYLPHADEPATSQLPDTTAADLPRGSETVLLVEDEQGVRTLAEFLLRRGGYTVLQAPSGAEALALAGQHMGPIHLLLTDVVMPGMSGRELAEHLANDRPGTKTLFMSGYTDDTVVRHGVLQAEAAFTQKPFTFDALLRKVREVLDG
jgi:signal transduction histidine kinase